jgi:malonyl-CoA/methylmalonyl-CoA synthetase
MSTNHHLYCALRAGFPADLDSVAIEVIAPDTEPLNHTWRDLDRVSAQMANLLASLGLEAAARVFVQVEKSPEALFVYLAVLRAGGVFVPINPAYTDVEVAELISDAQPSVLICTGARLARLAPAASQLGVAHVFTLNADRTGSWLNHAKNMSDQQTPAACRAEDIAVIIYTSGTTGRSKGVMLSHGNLLANARALYALWAWSAHDVLIHALPLFHVHGLFVAAQGALLAGARMRWLNAFSTSAVITALDGATLFMGVPTMFVRLLSDQAFTALRCSTMRLFISGSAPMRAETFAAFQARTGHTLLERYGMSETLILTSNTLTQRCAGSVGSALPGVEVRIQDLRKTPPTGRIDDTVGLYVGEIATTTDDPDVGEVEVRGPNVFKGYWQQALQTQAAFTADGWFKTGDLGHLDASGMLTLVGRSKELIISGGLNIVPAQIEAIFQQLPGVEDCAVFGLPHPEWGEMVAAAVVLQADAVGSVITQEVLIAQLSPLLVAYKIPKRLWLIDALPRNAMGKVQKNLLRKRFGALM